MPAAFILRKARPQNSAWSKLLASNSILFQGSPSFATPCGLLQHLHADAQPVAAYLPSSKHLSRLQHQPSSPSAHVDTRQYASAPGSKFLHPVGIASESNSFPPSQQRGTGDSADRHQTSVASLPDVSCLHAATTSTPRLSLPRISLSVLSHAAVHVTQDGTIPSRSLGELKFTTSTSVPSKQVPISSARFRHPYQQPCTTPWLASPSQVCNMTSSLSDPNNVEGTAAPNLEAAAYPHRHSAQIEVHAETQTHSISAPHLAVATCVSPAALFAPSYFRPDCWAAVPVQRQAKQSQQSAVPSCCALLHTTARAASTPADTQSEPRALVSATSEAEDVEPRRPARLQHHSAASQESDQCGNEADRDAGAQVTEGSRVVLYKGRYMQAFRMLVRFKIFQLVGIAALAVPINTFLAGGNISSIQMVMATSLIIGCGVASTTLWWFSQRYVGEMSLVVPNKLCFSVLDFWGNRQDTVVHIDQLIPPMQRLSQQEKAELIHQTVFPLDVSADRQYLISLRHGVLTDKPKLVELLTEGRISMH